MTYQDNIAVAKDKMLKAELELQEYLRCRSFDPVKGRRLSDAVKSARHAFVDQLESLWPRFPQ